MEIVKFQYVVFKGLYTNLSDGPQIFSSQKDNIVFSAILPKFTDETWKSWLGLKWDDLKESNAIVKIEMPTKNPNVLDAENQILEKKGNLVWNSMKLSASFCLEKAYFLNGTRRDDHIEIRSYSEAPKWYFSDNRDYHIPVNTQNLKIWADIYESLSHVYDSLEGSKFFRFNRGLLCFLKASEEQYQDFRMPMFVRAIEALIMPDTGKTTRQFKLRAKRWWPKEKNELFKGNAHDVLGEIYEMRCNFEHMHGLKSEHTGKSEIRAQQCEELARRAFRDILLDDAKLEIFESDKKIKNYWR